MLEKKYRESAYVREREREKEERRQRLRLQRNRRFFGKRVTAKRENQKCFRHISSHLNLNESSAPFDWKILRRFECGE